MASDERRRLRERDGAAELELERFLPYRLSFLTNRMSRSLARLYQSRFGLSPPQWRVIAVLARFPGSSANEVAERTAMDKVMVSRAIAGLVAQGRILRSLDSADRRRSRLRLSAKGQALYEEIAPAALAYQNKLLASLSDPERAALDRLLDLLAAHA